MTYTATLLLWRGAGRPAPEGAVPTDARCWWCGLASPGSGRPVDDAIPDTFPDRHRAALSGSDVLCAPCAWTMSDRIALPAELADAGIGRRLDEGGRLRASVDGDDPGKPRLFLRLHDGRVGVWSVGRNAAADEPWVAAREGLRTAPVDVGPCRLLAIVDARQIGAGATARFRNYHHVATPTTWHPYTNADRAALRTWLLSPPVAEPWVCVIGDGQKHGAIYASDAVVHPGDLPALYCDGAVVRYRPGTFAAQLHAVEQLRVAGASDEEVASGRYTRSGLDWTRAIRQHEPTVSDARQHPALMDVLLFLRRLPKEVAPAA